MYDAFSKIYTREGFGGFYTGVVQDTLKTAADSFLFFWVYNTLRQARLNARNRKQSLPVIDELGVGFFAGATAKFFTMPVSAIVTRLQTTSMMASRASGDKGESATVQSIAKQIKEEKGIQGFWSGYLATLILTLNPSLTFLFFENLKRMVLPQTKRNDPGPVATFLLAALSKALASIITYPFSLAKARSQASSKSTTGLETKSVDAKNSNASSTSAAFRRTNQAFQSTVLGTILSTAQTEGIGALYEGLQGEVMKGFLSHGITMLMKDAVHGVIIRLYFFLLKLLKRYPSPDELAQLAKERAKNALVYAQEIAADTAGAVGDKGKEALYGIEQAAMTVKEDAGGMSDFLKEYVGVDNNGDKGSKG